MTECPNSRTCTDTLTAEWAASGEIHYTKKRQCGNPSVPNVRPPTVDKEYFYESANESGYLFRRRSTVDCPNSDCQMDEETESALAQTYGEGKFQNKFQNKNYSKAVNDQEVFKYLSCIIE